MNQKALLQHTDALFEKFKAGDQDVLLQIIELLRPQLFDYSFRMTGQRDASLQLLDETTRAMLNSSPDQYDGIEQFRVQLYKTMRSFASHIWNADTSELINEGYELGTLDHLPQGLDKERVRQVELALAALPAWEKEPLILKVRSDFKADCIAEIMSTNEASTREGMNNGYIKIAQVCQLDPNLINFALTSVPSHSLSAESSHTTAALSQIMGDIEQSRGPLPWSKIIFGLIILLVLGAGGAYVALHYRSF